jgi:hypothetical protein
MTKLSHQKPNKTLPEFPETRVSETSKGFIAPPRWDGVHSTKKY